MLRRAATILVSLVIILVSIGGIVPDRAAAQDGDNQQLPPIEIPKKGNPKLDSALNHLVSLSDSQKQANFALEQSIQTSSGVRVIVECDESQVDSVAEALPGLGIVEARYDNLIQLVVPSVAIAGCGGGGWCRLCQEAFQICA